MRVKTVAVVYGRKINLGDYNSAELSCSMWADLDEGETAETVTAELQGQARALVKAEYQRMKATATK